MKPREPHEFDQGIELPNIELEDINVENKGTEIDYNSDYEFIREKLIMSLIRSEEVLTEAVKSVKMAPTGRNVEAASNALKGITDNTKALLELHEKIDKLHEKHRKKDDKQEESPSTIKSDLSKILKLAREA